MAKQPKKVPLPNGFARNEFANPKNQNVREVARGVFKVGRKKP